ncbi:MAG: c-type cytochrome [Gammaproteobacteria bacterium]|jgi:mono/diheme cytochrome c family protein
MSSNKGGKRLAIAVGIVIVIGLIVLAWAGLRPGPMDFAGPTVTLSEYDGDPTGVPDDFSETDPIARGRYLADAADCLACHTAEGGEAFAGGRAFHTEFGTIYSPNISPDPATGIGEWSDEDFLTAMHEGVGRDGEWLYPAFPYAAYTYLTDDDVLAIKAYLFAQPPVRNEPPEHTLRFPYNQRWLMSIWALLYNPDHRFEPVADRALSWNRGAYMVEALGHCGECHTPRTALQALDNRQKFAGGFAEGWRAYNLSSDDSSGIGNWSAADLEHYLKTGRAENRGSAFGPMAEAVHLSFAKMTDSDVSAIVEYIRSVPPVTVADLPAPKMEPAGQDPLAGTAAERDPRGLEIFSGSCAGCHGWTGENDLVPHSTFTGSRAVNDPSATNVALAVLHGAGELPASDNAIATMPAFGEILTDADIAAVSNYVIARFGAAPSSITAAEVAALREAY